MNKSKQITEGAVLTGIYIVLLLVSLFMPLISTLVLFVLPIPFIIFTSKHGWKPALLMAAAVALLSFILVNIMSIPMTLMAALGGIMIGSGLYEKRSAYETWARGTVGFAIAFMLTILFIQVILDVNISQEIDQQLDLAMQQSEDIINQFDLGADTTEQVDMVKEQMAVIKDLLPLAIVLASIVYAFVSQWLSYKIINRVDQKNYRFPPFRALAFPSAILWIYVVALLIGLFQSEPEGMFFVGVQNIIMLIGILLFLQGLSFVFYYTYHKKLSVALPIIVIIISIFYAPIAFPLIRILGIIDIGFKLREKMSDDKK